MSATPLVIESRSVADTLALGRQLGAALRGGEVLALSGPLGAGKTQLAKGIIAGAGAADSSQVTSPTFVLMNEYEGRVRVHHIDAYRLGRGFRVQGSAEATQDSALSTQHSALREADELADIGFEEMLRLDGCVLIEWADRVASLLPADRLTIEIAIDGPTARTLSLLPTGPMSSALLARTGLPALDRPSPCQGPVNDIEDSQS